MWQLVLMIAALALVWAYTRWARVKRFWAELGVPHLRAHPLYGSLDFLHHENPAVWMRRIYDRKSPYTGIWLFWRPALIINSPEIARRILVKDSDYFRDRFLGTGTTKGDPIGGLSLVLANDPLWSSLRRHVTPVFTSAKLKGMHTLNLVKSKELVQRIDRELAQKKDIEIRSVYSDFTTDITSIFGFGVDSNATLTGESLMRTITLNFMEYDLFRSFSWYSIFFFPTLVNIFRFKLFPRHTTRYFKKMFRSLLAQRGGYAGTEHHDLFGALLKMKHQANLKGEAMDENLVLAQALTFVQAGFDTSAVMLTYITYELAFQPEIQDKLYNELLEARQRNDGNDLDGNILSELTYMNCVINDRSPGVLPAGLKVLPVGRKIKRSQFQALRKYPAMGWLDRVASKDYQIDENLTVPAGMPVYVNVVGMHYDPEYFPDPDNFDPDRFLPEREQDINPFTFMPFGQGPRNCIGTRYAYRVLWYALSSLFLKYKVKPKPNAKTPDLIEPERRALFLMPGEELTVDFILRE